MTRLDGKFGKGLALGLLTLGYVILFFSIAKLFGTEVSQPLAS